MRFTDFLPYLMATTAALFFVNAIASETWSTGRKLAYKLVAGALFTAAVGVYWLTTGDKPDETLIKRLFCPLMPNAPKCSQVQEVIEMDGNQLPKARPTTEPPQGNGNVEKQEPPSDWVTVERPAPTRQAEGSPSPKPERDLSPISCEDYKKLAHRATKFHSVACNSKTAPGYYWAVIAPRIRPYGYWGLIPTGSIPACATDADVGNKAESAAFETAMGMWEVREFYCRGAGPEGVVRCASPDGSGPLFESSNYHNGVFSVVCRKQE